MKHAREILDDIFGQLDPAVLRRYIDEPLRDAIAALDLEVESTYTGFTKLLIRIIRVFVPSVDDASALAQARVWLNEKPGGFDLALLEFLEGGSIVMESITQRLLVCAIAQKRKRYERSVFAIHLAPLNWQERLDLVRECKRRFDLPGDLAGRPDWCLVESVEELIAVCCVFPIPTLRNSIFFG
ncbi:hypothetical protein [Cerasicoccus maritimus]|uniref:hypothetical protein n=1 Tax=Cerasicoccus maritimus TaxID=490089 RepID=UPI0028527566|nr:hypothetical protein [Cerasicoccus maritimus]